MYYVTQTNKETKETILLGYNLSERQKDILFYEFKLGENTSSNSETLYNGYGSHNVIYPTKTKAVKELITKPKEFNDALDIINKYGYVVYPKDTKVVSYQASQNKIF